MNNKAIDEIRRANPFPDELPLPPLEEVWRRVDAGGRDSPVKSGPLRRQHPRALPSVGGIMAAISVMTAIGVTVLAVALLGHDRSRPTGQATAPAAQSTTESKPRIRPTPGRVVSPQLVQHFALFRDPGSKEAHIATTSDLPPILQYRLAHLTTPPDPLAEYGLKPSEIREVSVDGANVVWVVPGAAGTCVFYPAPADSAAGVGGGSFGGCSLAAWVAQHGEIAGGTEANGTHVIYGLVPDGTTAVVLTMPSGNPISIPVANNVVFATVPAAPRSILLTAPSGNTVYR